MLFTKCNFGAKHKGRLYSAIAADDPSYLHWIIDKSEMSADIKYSAQYWLNEARRG